MSEATEDAQLWSWSEKAIASLFWSELEAVWKWGITRQKAGRWERWQAGDAPSCYEACRAMAKAFEDLAVAEGAPF